MHTNGLELGHSTAGATTTLPSDLFLCSSLPRSGPTQRENALESELLMQVNGVQCIRCFHPAIDVDSWYRLQSRHENKQN